MGKYAIARRRILFSPLTKDRTERRERMFFGPAGVPISTGSSSTLAGIGRVADLGLGCMEIQFGHGVGMSEEVASSVRKVAAERGVRLTIHAPYFINLNASEAVKVGASKKRILHAARIGAICGAEGIVFHAAFYLKSPPAEVYTTVKKHLEEITQQLREEGNNVLLRPEVMGKGSQFGSLQEILDLSAELEGVAPCLDLSHWHARTGAANSYPEFVAILDQVESKLGRQALDTMHLHLAGIDYGEKGERKHLLLEESDFRYEELLRALKERKANGLVICESPNLEEDALLLQKTYHRIGQPPADER